MINNHLRHDISNPFCQILCLNQAETVNRKSPIEVFMLVGILIFVSIVEIDRRFKI